MADTGLALSTRGLKKSYGSRLALDGLDLTVPTGVVYGFLGPNGAGKTTTMRLLTGLIHPDGGAIEVLGKPFTRRDRRRLFDVGALVESPAFYPYLSGRENLRALAASGAPVPAGRVDEVLELVGLARALGRQGVALLARDEAAARDRRGAPQRPEAPPPRRAGQRPRPGGDRGDARDPAPPRLDRQDGLRLEPPARRGPADGRRRRDHRGGPAGARRDDAGAARLRGRGPREGRARRGPGGRRGASAGSSIPGTSRRRPGSPAGSRSRSPRSARPR